MMLVPMCFEKIMALKSIGLISWLAIFPVWISVFIQAMTLHSMKVERIVATITYLMVSS